MKIVKIELEVKYIELKTPFITALRTVEKVEFVRVRVECTKQKVAFGEAPATKAITGEDIEMILDSIDTIKDDLVDKKIDKALDILHKSKIGSSAKAALDMTFISLLAQEKNIALYKYFGAKSTTSLYTDITISLNKKDKMLRDAKEAVDDKFLILKLKLGSDIKHAIDVTKIISNELPQAKLLIDANQAWSLQDTLFYIKAIDGFNIELIEQPVVANDTDNLKKITQKSNIPIMADEAVFCLDDVKKIMQSKSADMINIKLMKCGGVTKAIEILKYARKNKIKCMFGSMLEGPISINIALHLALAYPDVIKYIDLDSPLLYKELPSELDFKFDGYKVSFIK